MNKADSFLNDEIGPILEHPKKNNIKTEAGIPLKLVSDFDPSGDQPVAIKELVEGINNNERSQVLLGVTGSGNIDNTSSVYFNFGLDIAKQHKKVTGDSDIISVSSSYFKTKGNHYFSPYIYYSRPNYRRLEDYNTKGAGFSTDTFWYETIGL